MEHAFWKLYIVNELVISPQLILAWCRIYASRKTAPISLVTHIYVNKSDMWNADFGGLEISICHQIVNTLELSAPPPLQKKKKKKWWSFKQQTHVASKKNGRIVNQSSDSKTSSIQVSLMSLEAWLSSLSLVLWLFSWYRSFAMCIRTNISGFSQISSTVTNRYRRSTSLLKRSVSITSIS